MVVTEEMFKPFTNYTIEIDEELEEVAIEAWDDQAPADTFRARRSLEDLLPLLRILSKNMRRW